jgi:hypothetical protein
MVLSHEIFGKSFTRFQTRSRSTRPRDGQPTPLKLVNDPNGERRFAANYGQIDLLLLREIGQRGNVLCVDVHTLGKLCNACVAGRTKNL